MEVLYNSTRGAEKNVKASEAVLKGLAGDGGLFVPDHIPALDIPLESIKDMNYRELAFEIMSRFLTDYTDEELHYCIDNAYDSKFDDELIAPLKKTDKAFFIELFHGKTIAFKDMALSILPYLMTTAAKKNDIHDKIVILTATSGDTGKAAMAGFADVPGTSIIVFYPKNGVSPVQERQMVTQKGENTCVIAIRGNFDDAQTEVKKIFGDAEMARKAAEMGCRFSSANSINIGRLVPQIVYYVYAYAQLMKAGEIAPGDKINITVPTGNFGNILAAHYARRMGLPVNKLICASNRNKVLFDFFSTGKYDKNREFYLTPSPSMDILVSSNLERLIYEITLCDAEKTAQFMEQLRNGGIYEITPEMGERLSGFYGNYASDQETADAIRSVYEKNHYVIDTHTAVGESVYEKYVAETGDTLPAVIASTASPYKFARSVLAAIDEEKYGSHTDLEQFDDLNAVSGVKVPAAIEEIKTAPVRHELVVDAAGMRDAIIDRIRESM